MKKIMLNDANDTLRALVRQHEKMFSGLEDVLYIEVFKEKECIFPFNQPVKKLHYLIEGRAKTNMVHEDGKRSIVSFLKPEDFIGELSLIGVDDEPKDIVAISECICLTIPMAIAKERLLENKDFLYMLNQYIGRKLIRRTWYYMKSQNYELKNRLAAYMLISESKGFYREKHTEAAEFLGVSYRHLLHTIKVFVEEGLIVKVKQGYEIDVDQLKDLAKDFIY